MACWNEGVCAVIWFMEPCRLCGHVSVVIFWEVGGGGLEMERKEELDI